MNILEVKTKEGKTIRWDVDRKAGKGKMKQVYFSPDGNYVVARFLKKLNGTQIQRIKSILGRYRVSIFSGDGGAFWNDFFCWPSDYFEYEGGQYIVMPKYGDRFVFSYGSIDNVKFRIKGKEKDGKWFIAPGNWKQILHPAERGDWRQFVNVCLSIARATRRMNRAGLAHSDLSEKNVLVDPLTGSACIIDIDGLVVPDLYQPDVLGTRGYIAPEILKTLKNRKPEEPCVETDRHSLAVLIYMYLLHRHPLLGNMDIQADNEDRKDFLLLGERALFIEHPADRRNRLLYPSALPWEDTNQLPYTIAGPYLSKLIEKAFVAGLHDPSARPAARDWEAAIFKTLDLLQPCSNPKCDEKWFVFDGTVGVCPFCRVKRTAATPVLDFYSKDVQGEYVSDNHQIPIHDGKELFPWHVMKSVWNKSLEAFELLTDDQKRPVAKFEQLAGRWFFVNKNIPELECKDANGVLTKVPVGDRIQLSDMMKFALSSEKDGRLLLLQFVR